MKKVLSLFLIEAFLSSAGMFVKPQEASAATLNSCLSACSKGTSAIQAFCRSIRDPRIKAGCWAVQFASRPACNGFCYLWY